MTEISSQKRNHFDWLPPSNKMTRCEWISLSLTTTRNSRVSQSIYSISQISQSVCLSVSRSFGWSVGQSVGWSVSSKHLFLLQQSVITVSRNHKGLSRKIRVVIIAFQVICASNGNKLQCVQSSSILKPVFYAPGSYSDQMAAL